MSPEHADRSTPAADARAGELRITRGIGRVLGKALALLTVTGVVPEGAVCWR